MLAEQVAQTMCNSWQIMIYIYIIPYLYRTTYAINYNICGSVTYYVTHNPNTVMRRTMVLRTTLKGVYDNTTRKLPVELKRLGGAVAVGSSVRSSQASQRIRTVLSCEWRIKCPAGRPGRRATKYIGPAGRVASLNEILPLDKWTGPCTILNCEQTLKLMVLRDYVEQLRLDAIPSNIEVVVVDTIDVDALDTVSMT